MRKSKTFRTFAPVLVALVYAFAVLFSGQFHQHSHGFSGDDAFGEYQKNTSTITVGHDNGDCLACHFFFKNQGFSPIDFTVDFFSQKIFSLPNNGVTTAIGERLILFFNLRAPPIL